MGLFNFFKKRKNEKESNKVEVQVICSDKYKKPQLGPFDSLYSTVVFLNAYKRSPILPEDKYYRYTYTELGITNPVGFHKKLISQGYLIADEKSENYILSEKGKEFLKCNQESILIHRYGNKFNVHYKDFFNYNKTHNTNLNYLDVAEIILQDNLKKSNNLICDFSVLFQLYLAKNDKKTAFNYFLAELYLELNNFSSLNHIETTTELIDLKIGSPKKLLPFSVLITESDLKQIKKFKDFYNEQESLKICKEIKLKHNICTITFFDSIIKDIINDCFSEKETMKVLKKNWNEVVKLYIK